MNYWAAGLIWLVSLMSVSAFSENAEEPLGDKIHQGDEPDFDTDFEDGPIGDELSEDFQGEALAYSQGERREDVDDAIGIGIFGGAAWQSLELGYLMGGDSQFFSSFQVSAGDSTKFDDLEGSLYRLETTSYALGYRWMWFVWDALPFYWSAEAGMLSAKQGLSPHGSGSPEITGDRSDLGLYGSGGMGFLWLSQENWYWGIHIYHASKAILLHNLSESGTSESQDEMVEVFEQSLYGASINLKWGLFL